MVSNNLIKLLKSFNYCVSDIPNMADYEWDMILERCIQNKNTCEDEIYSIINSDAMDVGYFKNSFQISEYLNCRHRDLVRFIKKNDMIDNTDIFDGYLFYGFTKRGCAKLFFKYRETSFDSLENFIGKLII